MIAFNKKSQEDSMMGQNYNYFLCLNKSKTSSDWIVWPVIIIATMQSLQVYNRKTD